MANYLATVHWQIDDTNFIDRKYSRVHQWSFDGGITVRASPSPHVMRSPMSSAQAIDPEEAFVAAISSCHMLWFLDLASKEKIFVTSYTDHAVGKLAKNRQGKIAMTKVMLYPSVSYKNDEPSVEVIRDLHHRAHEVCFIANSVNTEIEVVL